MIDFRERNFGCRGRQLIYRGLRTVMLENEKIRVTILADKGTDILEFLYKPFDVDYLWRSPLDIRDPAKFIASSARSDGAFMDYYEGGWLEAAPVFPDGVYKGAEFGQTGEIALIPWEYIIKEDSPERVEVFFQVRTYRTPFLLQKSIALERNQPVLHISEKLTNEGEEEMELMWAQHPVYGAPFLDENCVIDTNAKRMRTLDDPWAPDNARLEKCGTFNWPHGKGRNGGMVDFSKIPPSTRNSVDFVFIDDFDSDVGWYALTNTKSRVGIGLAWSTNVFPYIFVWQDCKGSRGQPWYGRIYCTAIEMWSSFPLGWDKVLEAGTQIILKPGEAIKSRLIAVAYSGYERISEVKLTGEVIPK